ncbi:MAG TPA: SMI1/KNR4 family protein [Chitinolyticbacter sp.]|nr:SMI1/KNR4 family protein [Chitinolyticbacter sp.]
MKECWTRIENRLKELGCLGDIGLRPGASESDILSLEQHLGIFLPDAVKQFLLVHDGQDGPGLFYGQEFLSVSGIRQQWDNWRSIDEVEMNEDCADFMGSDPEGVIKPMYCNRAWIPLTHDWGGNHIGLDFDPGALGKSEQIIAFGRDEDIKQLRAETFDAFLASFESWLARAKWDGEYLDATDSI